MAKFIPSSPTVAFFSVMLLAATCVDSQSQSSTSFTVDTFLNIIPPSLSFQGDAHLPTTVPSIRLTGTRVNSTTGRDDIPESWSAGRIVYTTPVQFSERATSRQASFETNFSFIISPSQGGSADGIAFFIAPVGSTIPLRSAGGNLGIYHFLGTPSRVFAVEIDTYANLLWDPSYPHIGINIGSRVSSNTTRYGNPRGLVDVRIRYDAVTKRITVEASTSTMSASWGPVSYVSDLKNVLPERVWVGISGSTGGSGSGIHDILNWSFTSTLVDDA